MGRAVTSTIEKGMAVLATAAVAVVAAACSSGPVPGSRAPVALHRAPSVTGVVTSVSPTRLVVQGRTGTRTIALGAATTYSRHHVRVSGAALADGERVRVRLTGRPRTTATAPTAAAVSILGATVAGTVGALSPTGFTVTTKTGATTTVTVGPTTTVRQGRAVVGVSSLQAGLKVRVIGAPGPNGTLVATSIRIR